MTVETVTLQKFVYGGDLLGRLDDGRAVFVPYGLPGETVRVRLIEDKKRFARADLVEVLEPSPERIQPRCKHHFSLAANTPKTNWPEVCGGCHYQHVPYQEQLAYKRAILADQLERIGKLESPPVQATVASPQPWCYRNHIQFHVSPEGQLGFQAPRGAGVLAIEECHLPEKPINELWPQLEIEAIPGLDRVAIRLGANDDLLIILESSEPEPVSLNVDIPVSVVHLGPGGLLVLAGDDHIVIEVNGRLFRVSAESFFQVNTPMAAKMVDYLLENLDLTEQTTLIDAYCGVGLFSAFLAPHVGNLIGIESSPSACDDFVINLDEFDHVALYQAPVEDVLPELEANPEVILVDPPRSGLDRRALDGILALKPETVAYVSCDPATLARDAKRLTRGGYRLETITPFDLFPQTYHIESISIWVRA